MMDRLRFPMQALGVNAFLICALSLAGLGMSHARPANASTSVPVHRIHGQPCNAACKAYLAWSDRVTAMFRPSRPLKTHAARHRRPPHMMAHHAPRTPRRGLNSFAQWPVQSDAQPESVENPQAADMPQAAETPQAALTAPAAETPRAAVAPFRPVDKISDRFPAVREFMTAKRAGTDGAAPDAAESTVVAVAGTAPFSRRTGAVGSSAGATDIRLIAALLLALSTLPALLFFVKVDRQARLGPRALSALDA